MYINFGMRIVYNAMYIRCRWQVDICGGSWEAVTTSFGNDSNGSVHSHNIYYISGKFLLLAVKETKS